jgi:hypothetical protein
MDRQPWGRVSLARHLRGEGLTAVECPTARGPQNASHHHT